MPYAVNQTPSDHYRTIDVHAYGLATLDPAVPATTQYQIAVAD